MDIYRCCIKLLTDIKYLKERWKGNFYPVPAHVHSHGRFIATEEKDKKLIVRYNKLSKKAGKTHPKDESGKKIIKEIL